MSDSSGGGALLFSPSSNLDLELVMWVLVLQGWYGGKSLLSLSFRL